MEDILNHPRVKRLKEEYLSNPNRCLFCKSENIHSHSPSANNTSAWLSFECKDCGRNWTNEYMLVSVLLSLEDYEECANSTGRISLHRPK